MRAVLLLSIVFIGVLSLSLVSCEETGNEEIVDFVFDASQNDVPNDDVPEDDSDVTSTIVTLEGKHVFITISDFKLRYLFFVPTKKEHTKTQSQIVISLDSSTANYHLYVLIMYLMQ